MPDKLPFRHRAHEVSRLEAFSDIVFGFALTLIVVSLEVPESFSELMQELSGVLGFACCFAILMWLWHAHYTFFRRYGLADGVTMLLNTVLLFIVLVYVYPLKFLFASVTGGLHHPMTAAEASKLFVIYGAGFVGVMLLLVLLHAHALRLRDQLQLTPVEIHDTRSAIWQFTAQAVVGLLSIALALMLPVRAVGLAGWTYFLLGPVSGTVGAMFGKRRRAVEEKQLEAVAAA